MEYKVSKLVEPLDLVEITKFVTPEEPIIYWLEAEKDEEIVLANLYKCYVEGIVFIAKNKEGKIIGLIAGFPTNIWWNTSKQFLTDLIFYVLPKYRKTGVGDDLLNNLKNYAKNKQMSLMLTLFTQKDLEVKEKFIKSKDFEKTGTIFWLPYKE